MAKHFSKKVRKQGMSFRLPYICNLNKIQVLSGCPSMPDATSLHHCLKDKRLILNDFSGQDPAKEVFNIMHT